MKQIKVIRSIAAAAVLALESACGGGPDDARTRVQRADSAGVEIVTSGGTDVPLAWRFEPVRSIGGREEGPESFFQIDPTGIAADARGNVYVLDRGNHRVVVFGPDGRHLRSTGRKGGGPGEMQFPSTLALAPDGSVGVLDPMLGQMVRFGPDGGVLPGLPLDRGGGMPEAAAFVGNASLLLTRSFDAERGSTLQLAMAAGADTTLLARVQSPPGKQVKFPNCQVTISSMPPLFQPSISWNAAGGRVAVNRGPEYEVRLFEGARHVRTLRRGVAPQPATRELAERAVPRGEMTIRFGSGECRIPAGDVVEAQGFAPLMPTIARIAVAPDGGVWVARYTPGERKPPVDVFGADGAYLGTLPAGSPFPAAFLPDGGMLSVEEDELEVQRVVVYRIDRGSAAERGRTAS